MSLKNKKNTSNYDFFIKLDTTPYEGEWIAIADKKIIAHGKNADAVYKSALKKAGKNQISLAKAPYEQMLVLKL